LQQATRVAEQHLPVIRQRDAACRAPEQGTLGLELEPLDLLAYRRLRRIEPLDRSMEAAAIGTATKARNSSKSSMILIPFYDQSYYEISFL
jgi:hypothetical protein